METKQKALPIYIDGRLSYSQTYMPIVIARLQRFGRQIDFFFTQSRWPHNNEV
jgi:hypothetical protein